MNKERILDLANKIEALPESKFKMDIYFCNTVGDNLQRVTDVIEIDPLECGTAGCIAGWAVAFYAKKGDFFPRNDVEFSAGELLGLSLSLAAHLFFGALPGMSGLNTSQKEAVTALRRLGNGEFDAYYL